MKKIAIVYLSYHCEPYLDDVISAWKKLTYPKEQMAFVIVDNLHPQYGSSMRVLEDRLRPISGKDISEVIILPQTENLGFAGGNNVGINWALDHGFDYVFLHNCDGFMDADCLEPLVEAMEEDKVIGLAQSLVLLYPETDLVNAAGNSCHYLGFGFCNEYRTPVRELALPKVAGISYASGAAVMLRSDLLRQYGLWDKDFFLYHEDMEYALRLRIAGYRAVLVRASRFYHKYNFGRSIEKFYWMERNRWAVIIMFFRLPTIILLSPMLILLEFGLWLFAIRGGWVNKRVAVYRYWLNPKHWPLWYQKRKFIQSIRQRRDRDLLLHASAAIKFQEKTMENPVLMYLGNPLMSLYYWVVVRGLIWW